jgi:uncharacterized protein YbjT (DUF2867 family)
MKIVVMGGGGLIGKKLVAQLQARGHQAVAASPSTGVNAVTGEGLASTLQNADVVVDVTNSPSFEDAAVMEFFTKSTSNLLAAEGAAGVRQHVALSIVGADRIPDSGYMRAKVAQEQLIRSAAVPYTIVRATQFFEFMAGIIAQFPSDERSVRVPPVSFQPVLSDDVVAALVEAVLAPPANGVIDLAGPERYRFHEVVGHFLSAQHDARLVEADPGARYFGARLNDDSLVPTGDARTGATHFADWLTQAKAAS